MLQEKNIPVQALKFIPGFGEQVQQLLYGDPYQAHTFFADMLYHVQSILDQDKDWDPVEVTRRQEFAEAEKRARDRASSESATSGPVNDSGTDRVGQVNAVGFVAEKIPRSLSDIEGIDY